MAGYALLIKHTDTHDDGFSGTDHEPHFEHESSWEGGSFESKVYAFEKTDAGYALLIKHTDTHDDDYLWRRWRWRR